MTRGICFILVYCHMPLSRYDDDKLKCYFNYFSILSWVISIPFLPSQPMISPVDVFYRLFMVELEPPHALNIFYHFPYNFSVP